MAARQQQKGTGSGIQYEDLVPKSEWKDQPEATLLTIDLPGFTKEQIKVTYVHTSRMIRVTGERPLTDRRWSRFNEVFTVPQNCLVDKIHGSFKNNVLAITMPKETITKMPYLPEPSKTVAEKVEKLEEKRLLEEYRTKEKALEEAERKKKLQEEAEKKQKLQEEKEGLIRKLKEDAKAKEMAEAKKLQEEAKAKEMAEARKLQEEARAKEKLVEEARLEKKIQERKFVNESGGKEKILKPEERKLPEVVYTKPGTGSGTKSVSEKVGEVVKSAEEKVGYMVEKEKKRGKGIMEKIRGKEITSEEKKLMVNVGVAALVIFALGAYVSYTFCSSSSCSSSSSSSPSSSSSSAKPE